jgi:hypothetical protein
MRGVTLHFRCGEELLFAFEVEESLFKFDVESSPFSLLMWRSHSSHLMCRGVTLHISCELFTQELLFTFGEKSLFPFGVERSHSPHII